MLERRYNIRWDSYKNNLCIGFSKLQQKQEFVDVTLAAEGHLVGAHRNILALASPYFKEMLKSAPCPHPIIFLGPITHTTLAFILEYMYTGEVSIPSCVLPSFVDACKMLHIAGAEDIEVPQAIQDARVKNDIPQQYGNFRPLDKPNEDGNQMNVQPPMMEGMNASQIIIDTQVPNHLSTLCHNESIRPVNIQDYNALCDQNKLCEQLTAVETKLPLQGHYIAGENMTTSNEVSIQKEENVGFTNIAACIKIDNGSHEVSVQPLINYNVNENEPHSDDDNENYLPVPSNNSPQDQPWTEKEDYEMTADFEELIESQAVAVSENNKGKTYRMHAEHEVANIPPESSGPEELDFKLNVPTDSGLLTISNVPSSSGSKICETANNDFIGNISALYTKSSRDAIIMILNRYIYNLHHKSYNGNKCRWRCINYRMDRCPAFVDIIGENITSRKNMHNHAFHDSKIVKLGKRHELYTTLAEATKKVIKKKD